MTYVMIASDVLIEEERRCRGLAVEQAARATQALTLAGYCPTTDRLARWVMSWFHAAPRRRAAYIAESAARIASGET